MNKEKTTEVIEKLKKAYPNSKVSLDFNNAYELLVATILSAQTTDKAVNKVTPDLFSKFPNIEALAEAEVEEVAQIIRTLGFYKTKAKNLVKMARKVVEEFNGEIPRNMEDLTSLPGVGRKTANVVLGNAFGIPDSGITVDTHVKRITRRLGWTKEEKPEKIEKDLMKIIPVKYWVEFTPLIIDHGRAICRARKPMCEKCPIEEDCPSSTIRQV
ncbi:MAG: endonuclease III [Methanobacteriota archaeon]|nr:MAG: endonuclease III [Euryarchaeota archaeon]